MPFDRVSTVDEYLRELDEFAALVRSLSDEQWAAPTRCEGWSCADIAAHVVGLVSDLVAGNFGGLSSPDRQDEIVKERKGRTQAQIADEADASRAGFEPLLRAVDDAAWDRPVDGIPENIATTFGQGMAGLWHEVYVHGDDIRDAAALPSARGAGLRASIEHVGRQLAAEGFGPLAITSEELGTITIGDGRSSQVLSCDPLEFLLVATGRLDHAKLGLPPEANAYRPRP